MVIWFLFLIIAAGGLAVTLGILRGDMSCEYTDFRKTKIFIAAALLLVLIGLIAFLVVQHNEVHENTTLLYSSGDFTVWQDNSTGEYFTPRHHPWSLSKLKYREYLNRDAAEKFLEGADALWDVPPYVKCPDCGELVKADYSFCPDCGARMNSEN